VFVKAKPAECQKKASVINLRAKRRQSRTLSEVVRHPPLAIKPVPSPLSPSPHPLNYTAIVGSHRRSREDCRFDALSTPIRLSSKSRINNYTPTACSQSLSLDPVEINREMKRHISAIRHRQEVYLQKQQQAVVDSRLNTTELHNRLTSLQLKRDVGYCGDTRRRSRSKLLLGVNGNENFIGFCESPDRMRGSGQRHRALRTRLPDLKL
jgi:hypothetical protein